MLQYTLMMGVMLSCCPQGIFSADPVPSAKYKQSRRKQLTSQLRDTGSRNTRDAGSKVSKETQSRNSLGGGCRDSSGRRGSIQPPRSSERRGSFINFEDSSTNYGSTSASRSSNLLLAPSKSAHRRRASVY